MKLNRHYLKKENKYKQIHLIACLLLQVLPRTHLSLISCNRHKDGYNESVRLSQSLTLRSRQIAFRFGFSPAYKNLYVVRERNPFRWPFCFLLKRLMQYLNILVGSKKVKLWQVPVKISNVWRKKFEKKTPTTTSGIGDVSTYQIWGKLFWSKLTILSKMILDSLPTVRLTHRNGKLLQSVLTSRRANLLQLDQFSNQPAHAIQ